MEIGEFNTAALGVIGLLGFVRDGETDKAEEILEEIDAAIAVRIICGAAAATDNIDKMMEQVAGSLAVDTSSLDDDDG